MENSVKCLDSDHYQLSTEFYSLFLDDTLSYSCAEFTNNASLTEAQIYKMDNIIEKYQ